MKITRELQAIPHYPDEVTGNDADMTCVGPYSVFTTQRPEHVLVVCETCGAYTEVSERQVSYK